MKENDFDLSYSDPEEDSHSQYAKSNIGRHRFQFAQLDAEFEPGIAQLLKQSSKIRDTNQIDLREIILLDSQSTMDMFFNFSPVEKIKNQDPQFV